jgi:hypothetical protein
MAKREAEGETQERLCPRRFVRCVDDTLAKDFLTVGQVYEVLQIKERDGYYVLSSGQFTMARFQPVSPTDAGYG